MERLKTGLNNQKIGQIIEFRLGVKWIPDDHKYSSVKKRIKFRLEFK